MQNKLTRLFLLFSLVLSTTLTAQQNVSFLRVSPHAKVFQNVGFATIEIDYNRPAVKGREIWGKLVPYGLAQNNFGNGNPMPWRAGANENTTITLSNDAEIEGQKLQSGKYSIHLIPNKNSDWILIFNKNHDAWGSFFYDVNEDALRIKVKPIENQFTESLEYSFENITPSQATVCLKWEKLKIPFTLTFNDKHITYEKYKHELSSLPGFNQAAWSTAARYLIQNNFKLDEAEKWVNKSLSMNGGKNFTNLSTKASLLKVKGNAKEAKNVLAMAYKVATETELNQYGYRLMGQGNLEKAISIFKMNTEKFPNSWNVFDSLAEALEKKGEANSATEYYKKALELAPENQKKRIKETLSKITK